MTLKHIKGDKDDKSPTDDKEKVGKTCFLLEVCQMKKRKKTGTVWSDKRKIAHIK